MVLTAITEIRRSAPASVLPGLNPNQPKARMKQPRAAIGMLWPGIGLAEPSLLYLPIRAPRTIAPASAVTPPTMWTTEEPAKSTWPWPRPKFLPSCDSQPPPHTQLANSGYVNIEMKKPKTTNDENFHRSAMAPVGIVAAVSMNTIWKRKSAKTATSEVEPARKKPFRPNRPDSSPNTV